MAASFSPGPLSPALYAVQILPCAAWLDRDGLTLHFASQVSDDANVMLNGFGTVVNSLKMRAKPYLPQICGTIKWRLNNKSAKIRQQAADLIARIAVVMKVGSPHPCSHVPCTP